MAGFHVQDGPVLGNQYSGDQVLRGYLQRVLPADVLAEVEPDLLRFGGRVAADVLAMAADAEANPPRLASFDAWGQRIDQIETARGWQELERVSAEEGLVAIGYERKYGAWSRVYQLAKLYLFDPSSAVYSCPLAMTDGAARLLEVHAEAGLRDRALPRLTSRDPAVFWTSGQWMTERAGGSDVGRTGTTARLDEGGAYRLYGDKWFTSATTSQMAMTLARIEDEAGSAASGSRGLSLFYLETRLAGGELNGITIHRLKDKLGTKALPTAELTMSGTRAMRIGAAGDGVRTMATLFNLTRIYNAVCASAKMRRAVVLARDYARRREAFGKLLADHPLHLETLAALEVEARAGLHLVFSLGERLGRVECAPQAPGAADEAAILRLLTPVAKLYTAKQGVAVASEALECFGGAGYVENTGVPKLLRDAQVLSIWEGTTNVLSLDVLRAIERDGALPPFLQAVAGMIGRISHPALAESVRKVKEAAAAIGGFAVRLQQRPRALQEASARAFGFALARTYAGAALLEQASWSLQTGIDPAAVAAACRWCQQDLAALAGMDAAPAARAEATRALAL